MRVAVVAEYYPRRSQPGLGIWAHRQALAVREQGIDVRVLALERPLPSLRALRALAPGGGGPDLEPLGAWLRAVRSQATSVTLDGIPIRYVRFVSPPRPTSYASWGRWAAPALAKSLEELDREWGIDLVHAHYAVPAGDAARRWTVRMGDRPLVISVHGGDLSYAAVRSERGREIVSRVLRGSAAVIANSERTRAGVADLIGSHQDLRVVHLGADLIPPAGDRSAGPALITVAHLEAHKSQGDVIRALAILARSHPRLRYTLVGGGPDRSRLEALARSLGVAERVRFTGPLAHEQALRELAAAQVHVMASRHDAFGVAHLEAMAAGLPTIGGAGTGAEDIARAGPGMVLVEPGDVPALAQALDDLIGDPEGSRRLGEAARRTVAERFSWDRCGAQTAAVYAAAIERSAGLRP
jgi:teichuronic acid biosynthesis glycosyltransferase TuaC